MANTPIPVADFDVCEYAGATPLPVGRQVASLEVFGPARQLDIALDVLGPWPPAREIDLGLATISSRAWYEWHWYRGIDPDARYQPLTRQQRQRIIARDGYVCALCGGDVAPDDVHIDHRVPRALGGLDVDDNLQVSHSLCNLKKGTRV